MHLLRRLGDAPRQRDGVKHFKLVKSIAFSFRE